MPAPTDPWPTPEPRSVTPPATAATESSPSPVTTVGTRIPTLNRPNTVAVSTVVWLVSELMFFAGVFGIYFTAKAVSTGPWPPPGTQLHLGYGVALTVIAIASAATCQLGVRAISRADLRALRQWYLLTVILGGLFTAIQIVQYRILFASDTTISSSAYSTAFFLLTGFHLLQIAVGLVALAVTATRSRGSDFTKARATRALVLGYFWQFLAVLWLGVFAAIYLVR